MLTRSQGAVDTAAAAMFKTRWLEAVAVPSSPEHTRTIANDTSMPKSNGGSDACGAATHNTVCEAGGRVLVALTQL